VFRLSFTDLSSDDYNSLLQASLLALPVEEVKDQPKEDKRETFQVFMKPDVSEPQKREEKPTPQETSVPSPQSSPHINSSKMAEDPRQESSAPSRFSPPLDTAKMAESPKQELSGASSYFSKRLNSQNLVEQHTKQEVSTLPSSLSPRIESPPQQVVLPKEEAVASSPYFTPQISAPKAANPPIQAPSPRFSPPIKYPVVVQSPKIEVPAPSPPVLASTNPFRTAESQSPKQEFPPHFSPRLESPKAVDAPKPQSQSNSSPRNGFRGFMEDETDVTPRDFSAPSPRFTPRTESPKVVETSKQNVYKPSNPTNGSRGPPKEEVKPATRETNETTQEGVKVAPRPFSQQIHQSIIPISPRVSLQKLEDRSETEINRIATNSPPPAQKFRILSNASTKTLSQTSDSEREEIHRAPSVISNLSIDEMLMDIPVSRDAKDGWGVAMEVKGVERKESVLGNGNGNGGQTPMEEDAWSPPKNFKMKKSKKTFSTRY
jgi:hypothetical protein